MRRIAHVALFAVATLIGCSRPTPEQQIVNDAAAALGGRDRILAVRTLVIEGDGTQYNLGQDVVPNASGQTFAVTGYKRAIDVAGGRARTELTRTPNFTFFQGPAAQKQVNGIDGGVGYNVAPNGTARAWQTPRQTTVAPSSITTRSPRPVPHSIRWPSWQTPGPKAASRSSTSPPPTVRRSRWPSTAPPSSQAGS